MRKVVIPAVAGGAALAIVAGAGLATANQATDVILTVDGETTTVTVEEETVADVLAAQGIVLSNHDVVLPGADTRVSDELEITVLVARPLEVTVDGETREVWTTATSVQEALGFLNLDEADSKLSASRSTAIGREGLSLEIATAKDVTLTAAGQPTELTIAGTVQDVLDHSQITVDSDDILTPAADTVLEDGLQITYIDVEVTTEAKEVAIPFSKKTVESKNMDKGTSKVTTKGVDGVRKDTYTNVFHDGQLQSSKVTATEVLKEPVTEVTTVGTREKPKPAPRPEPKADSSSSSDSGSSEGSSSGSSSGKALNLARADMWDKIAQCESTGRWNINTGNGYYGGLQFNLATWRSVNGQDFAAYPHHASRAEQITVANRLYERRGLQPWSCARVLR